MRVISGIPIGGTILGWISGVLAGTALNIIRSTCWGLGEGGVQ